MNELVLKCFDGGGDNKEYYLSITSPQDMSPKEGFEITNLFFYDNENYVSGNICRMLLYFYYQGKIVLCNLTTKELKFIAPPKKPIQCNILFQGCGLGYDAKSGDYKLIQKYHLWSWCNVRHRSDYEETKTELYSLKSCSWKEIPSPDACICAHCGVYVEGSCYWQARLGSAFGGPSSEPALDVLSFDFTSECFSCIPSPTGDDGLTYDLVECRGFLGAIAYESTDEESKCGAKSFELLVWKESSWAKSYVVALYGIENPLGLKDGRFLFLKRKIFGSDKPYQLVVYDCITKELKKYDTDARAQNVSVVSHVDDRVELVYDWISMKVFYYAENCALLPNDAKISQNAEEFVLEGFQKIDIQP
ncbi:uncharacterized protein LOC131006214 [Salvia miltiorrhiza]|uniref:uncharacterized protein LOC131006214 n=1 Tax=Salvia miltiorrhiza TaxID=226208 RepID=UPI0025AD0ACA|nr:uncharacterized protein LOC131006214 [Salvia miltiorrhiza]